MSESQPPNSENTLRNIKQRGLVAVFPDEHTLLVDLDTVEDCQVYKNLLPILQQHFQVESVVEAPSQSGLVGKHHVTIRLTETLNIWQALAFQACLGSDRKRELLSMVQAFNNDPHPTFFTEKAPSETVASDEERSIAE